MGSKTNKCHKWRKNARVKPGTYMNMTGGAEISAQVPGWKEAAASLTEYSQHRVESTLVVVGAEGTKNDWSFEFLHPHTIEFGLCCESDWRADFCGRTQDTPCVDNFRAKVLTHESMLYQGVSANADVGSHPVGSSTPVYFSLYLIPNKLFSTDLQTKNWRKFEKKDKRILVHNSFADTNCRILWCRGTHRVYVHVYVYVFNLRHRRFPFEKLFVGSHGHAIFLRKYVSKMGESLFASQSRASNRAENVRRAAKRAAGVGGTLCPGFCSHYRSAKNLLLRNTGLHQSVASAAGRSFRLQGGGAGVWLHVRRSEKYKNVRPESNNRTETPIFRWFEVGCAIWADEPNRCEPNRSTYRQHLPKVCLQHFHGQDEDWFGIFGAHLVLFGLGIMHEEGIYQIWIFGFLRSKRSNLEV